MANRTSGYRNANVSSAAAPGTGNDYTKANAFMNVYYVQPDGKKYKIGSGLPFYDHKPRDLQIKDWLLGKDETDPAKNAALREKRLMKFMECLSIDFVEVSDEVQKLQLPE